MKNASSVYYTERKLGKILRAAFRCGAAYRRRHRQIRKICREELYF